jgi:tripartite-type tricarboxylate transporter receptor subunit TctC
MKMKRLAHCLLLSAALACIGSTPATAATHAPAGPINMIVPFSAGGSTDLLARIIGKGMADDLGTSVIVENKPGAEGFIAARALKQAKPDGSTLMLVTTSVYAINPAIFTKIPYDSHRDFVTIGMVASSPNVFLVNSQSQYHSLQDVIRKARSAPGTVNYATGATMHLLNAKWLEALSGTKMVSIPYKGSAAAYPDLVAGRVDFMVDQPLSSMPFIKQGKLRAIAVTSEKRWPQMPEVPTVAEQGYPSFSTTSWWAVLAPAGTPQEVVERLNATLRKNLATPDIQKKIRQLGADISEMTLAQSQQFTAQELKKWQSINHIAGVKIN